MSSTYRGTVLTLEIDLAAIVGHPPAPRDTDVPHHVAHVCNKAIEAAAAALGVPSSSLRSKSRAQPWVLGRQVAMHGAYEFSGASLSVLARWFATDHGTILYAHRQVEQRKRTDTRVAKLVASVAIVLEGTKKTERL